MGNVDRELLTQAFKPASIRYRDGAYDKATGRRKQLAYLDGATIIRRLNEACQEWHFEVVAEESRPIFDDKNTSDFPTLLMIAHGRLTIPELGTRDGIGVQEVKPNSGVDFNKGHYTDALKKCATLFGVGLELYGEDHESDEEPAAQPRRMDEQQRGQVEAQHQRNTSPPASSLPMTRRAGRAGPPIAQEPNGQEAVRQKVIDTAAKRGVPLSPELAFEDWAKVVDGCLDALDIEVRVTRQPDGTVLPGMLLNALIAIPVAAGAVGAGA